MKKGAKINLESAVRRLQQYITETTWHDIYNLNKDVIGTNPNLIKPGQVLKMPNGAPDYVVKPGDNLTRIASKPAQTPVAAPAPSVAPQAATDGSTPATTDATPSASNVSSTETPTVTPPAKVDDRNELDKISDAAYEKNQYNGNYDIDVAKLNWLVAKAKGLQQNPNGLMQTSKGVMAPNGFVAQSVKDRHASDTALAQNTSDNIDKTDKFEKRRKSEIEADLEKSYLWPGDRTKVRDWLESRPGKSVADAIKELNLKIHPPVAKESIRSILDNLTKIMEAEADHKTVPNLTPEEQTNLEILIDKLMPFKGKDDHLNKIIAVYLKLPDLSKNPPAPPKGQKPPVPGAKWTGTYWQLPESVELEAMLKIAGLR